MRTVRDLSKELILLLVYLVGCNANSEIGRPGPNSVEDGGSSGGSSETSGQTGGGTRPHPKDASVQLVPANANGLFSFLRAKTYATYASTPGAKQSLGPHGKYRAFYNNILTTAVSTKNATYPKDSAAILELYENDVLKGWAAEVKVDADSKDGGNWYWYEVPSTVDGTKATTDGKGVALCVDCHKTGKDFLKSNP